MDSIKPQNITQKNQTKVEQQQKQPFKRGWKGERVPVSDKFNKDDNQEPKSSFNSNDNLQFIAKKIQFYPEDEQKMKNMSLAEKIKYQVQLKEIGKFIVIPNDPNNITNE